MKFAIHRKSITIIPESSIDDTYIEEALGLIKDEDSVLLIRKNSIVEKNCYYLETENGRNSY